MKNAKKNKTWEEITEAVNAVGVTARTTQEVQEKWKNLQSNAKREFSSVKSEQKETGGGPVPPPPQTRRGQTTPLMFHEGYVCLLYIFLNQVCQMSFLCSSVYFNFGSCDKMSDYDVIIDDVTKTCYNFFVNSDKKKITPLERP